MAPARRHPGARVTSATRDLGGGRGPRDTGPFLITATVAVVAVAGFALAAARGWLGPDVGRGSGFCEAARAGWIHQPANTFSNLAFVAAGLAIAWHAGSAPARTLLTRTRPLVVGLGILVVLLGPGSAAMHATQSEVGGHLDMTSMYLVSSFALAYAATRLVRGGTWAFVRVFLAALLVQEIVELRGGPLPVLMHTGNLGFALTLLTAIGFEIVLDRRGDGVDRRWAAASLGSLLLAFGIWNLAKDGTPWCHPHSLLQGHAAWHILCAVAAYALYRAYAVAPTRAPAPTAR
ncbi:MAG: ceramidase domain-containing protein [Tetrasphaera sp.]|nr:ceramidase domain-containing protein [Tetrasphaera sp.]